MVWVCSKRRRAEPISTWDPLYGHNGIWRSERANAGAV